MMIDILLQAQAIPVVIGTADYAIGTAVPYILGAIGAGAAGTWVKNHWQEIKDTAGKRIVRPVFGPGRKYTVRSNPMVVQPDATRVVRPIVVPTQRDINLHLGETRAIPVYAGQSSTATPLVKKKKKARKVRPTITTTSNEEELMQELNNSGVEAEPETPVNENAERETTGTSNNGGTNTERTTDDRNILQRLGDRMARRKRQNNSTPNPENKPPRNWWDKTKTAGKWGMYGFIANEADNRFLNGGVKKIVKGVLDLGFDKPDTIYIEKPNNTQRQQTTINTPEQVIGYPTENDYR